LPKSATKDTKKSARCAIVPPHSGTTRDVIEVQFDLDYQVTVIDTAGIGETDDGVAQRAGTGIGS
jgi:tRNA modification GTPase